MADAAAAEGSSGKKWFPLESNPDVMTRYIERLGFDTSRHAFVDVLSTDDWALDMVPQPALAVLMLFPVKAASEAHRAEEAARIEREGQVVSPDVYYMKQTVGNACGTVGLLHAVGNAATKANDSFLSRFLARTRGQTPDAIATVLAEDTELEETHGAAAAEGQSAAPALDEDVTTHFVCFVEVGGRLYELDGRKRSPIDHGATTPAALLRDAARVVRAFMARDPEELRFTIVALAPLADE
ncbi:putative ubiquitin carboxyl-terminal hydrolase [Tribonema minus]|uniref:Ubiquitin carboxyl-terminal hydrolase n=1 Tax=Tribonema minus TaxID=303371 RepID=A0A835ZFE8_9STRA|nr:putative ubiquitin carboxyl-terminal hydrolase [Tribonema minus]